MILDVFIIALILSLVTKRIRAVINYDYKLLYLFPVPFILQVIPGPKFWLMLVSFALLIFLLLINRKIPGFTFIAAGMTLNAFIMLVNGGKMPVLESLAAAMNLGMDERHVLTDWNYWGMVLGDWIPAPLPWGRRFIISPGDILVYIGIFILFLKVRKPKSLPS